MPYALSKSTLSYGQKEVIRDSLKSVNNSVPDSCVQNVVDQVKIKNTL